MVEVIQQRQRAGSWSVGAGRNRRMLAFALLGTALLGTTPAIAQEIDFAHPTRHFEVERPAGLEGTEALIVYDRIVDTMVDGYVLSRDPVASSYRSWLRFNRVPYRSRTHGQRFVNNYANRIAAPHYGALPSGSSMPEGSILAKDSFAVTADGGVFSGPLFVMEKMPEGFSLEARDWKYSMIMPDGSYFGVSGGENQERVEFCISCHLRAGADDDHLFFVPEGNRVRTMRLDQVLGD